MPSFRCTLLSIQPVAMTNGAGVSLEAPLVRLNLAVLEPEATLIATLFPDQVAVTASAMWFV